MSLGLTILQAVVVCLDHALDAPALWLARIAIQRKAVADTAVDETAKPKCDELFVCNWISTGIVN